ncbi:MAG: magnesium transporter CorA family protein [Chitinophagales bacterium]
MIKFYLKEKNSPLEELSKAQKGCWINISPPYSNQELRQLSESLDIPLDFFIDSLDLDERSRFEQEDGVQLVMWNIPIRNRTEAANEAYYITVPIGIMEVDDYILTISAFENPVIDYFLENNVKSFSTNVHNQFVLLLFDRTNTFFLKYLKGLNHQRNDYEKKLYNSGRNQELSNLLDIQKSLVYFMTTLRDNELLLLRIKRIDFLKIRQDEEKYNFFEDIIIDTSQAQDMAQIYSDILNGTMNALASIVSNNLNKVMKRLTSITLILMVPTLVASFYGMNVPVWGQEQPFAFPLIIIISILLSFALTWFFRRKELF